MEGDLGFLMMTHADVHQVGKACDLSPFGYPSCDGGVHVQNIDTTVQNKISATPAGNFSLSCDNRNVGNLAQALHSFHLIEPSQRFLQPLHTQILDSAGKLGSLPKSPRLIGVAGNHKVFWKVLSDELHTPYVFLHSASPHFELDSSQTQFQVAINFLSQLQLSPRSVISTNTNNRDRISTSSPELGQGLPT